jgi:hypothetical protein
VARLKSLLAASIDSPVPPYEYSRRTLFDLASSPDTLDAVRSMQEGETPAWFHSCKPENPIVPMEEPHGTT